MPLTTPTPLNNDIAWMGLRMSLPEDWQPTRHSLNAQRGSLTFIDRRRQCLQLLWTTVSKTPDIVQVIEDYQASVLEEDDQADLEIWDDLDPWLGLVRLIDGQPALVRAATYSTKHKVLLEATLNADRLQGEPRQEARRILQAIKIAQPSTRATRWRLFDLDVQMPPFWQLTKMESAVADVAFTFTRYQPGQMQNGKQKPDKMTKDQAIIRRRAMASTFHKGGLRRYIQRQSPKAIFKQFDDKIETERTVTSAVGIEAGKRARRLLGLLRTQRERVFRVESEDALYQITTLTHDRKGVALILPTNIKLTLKSQPVSFAEPDLKATVPAAVEQAA